MYLCMYIYIYNTSILKKKKKCLVTKDQRANAPRGEVSDNRNVYLSFSYHQTFLPLSLGRFFCQLKFS